MCHSITSTRYHTHENATVKCSYVIRSNNELLKSVLIVFQFPLMFCNITQYNCQDESEV